MGVKGLNDKSVMNNVLNYIFFYCYRPERQQAVALWWKSKPVFKKPGREALPVESLDKGIGCKLGVEY